MTSPLQTYLTELAHIRATGLAVKETSYYTPLANLLNALGAKLNPPVSCLINPKNKGAGIPDGGFFTKDQLRAFDDMAPNLAELLPARGVMEVKSPAEDVDKIAASGQVGKYLAFYGLVLVTNYRAFLLVGQHPATGQLHLLERYALAPNEKTFWALVANPTAATAQNEGFCQFLWRVLSHNAPLRNPKDVAWFLASYARDARSRIEAADLLAALTYPATNPYQTAQPRPDNKFSFYPSDVQAHYLDWPKLTDLCGADPLNGMMEKRRGALFTIDRDALQSRMEAYFDKTVSWDTLQQLKTGLTIDAARF